MTETPASPPPGRRALLQIGPLKLTGLAALVAQFVLGAGIVALLAWQRPHFGPLWISGALWIGFIAYWSANARNTAPTASAESSRSRTVHGIVLDLAILLGFLHVVPLKGSWRPEGWGYVVAGLVAQALGVLLAIWARRHLGRNWSGRVEIKVGHELVRTGPYRRLRHPIYSAMLLMMAGTALVSGHWHGLLGLGLMLGLYARKLVMEERRMRETFGAEWEAWRRHSWALIPGLV
jgi:protein-S-isoprenylcysteine O-methyltransferase Ste14